MDIPSHETLKVNTSVDEYVESIRTPVEGIDGNHVRRISGSFNVKTDTHNFIVQYCGSLHESRFNSKGGSVPAEIDFIRRNIIDSPIKKILIEQGAYNDTENTLTNDLIDIVTYLQESRKYALDKLLFPRVRLRGGYSGEMDQIAREARTLGKKVVNIDLVNNPAAFQFIADTEGELAAVEFACQTVRSQIANEFDDEYRYVPPKDIDIVEVTLNLLYMYFHPKDISEEEVRAYITKYHKTIAEFLNFNNVTYTKEDIERRDKFMAQQLQAQTSNVLFFAHTTHIVNVIEKLKSSITQLTPFQTETARGYLEEVRKVEESKNKRTQE